MVNLFELEAHLNLVNNQSPLSGLEISWVKTDIGPLKYLPKPKPQIDYYKLQMPSETPLTELILNGRYSEYAPRTSLIGRNNAPTFEGLDQAVTAPVDLLEGQFIDIKQTRVA